MTFLTEKAIKACRKRHRCGSCNRHIEIGEPAINWVGLTDGEFGSIQYHPECRAAEIAINHLHGTFGDEWMCLLEIDDEDKPWLRDEHPAVAARMGFGA